MKAKTVNVTAYDRFRLGRWEHVTKHRRSPLTAKLHCAHKGSFRIPFFMRVLNILRHALPCQKISTLGHRHSYSVKKG